MKTKLKRALAVVLTVLMLVTVTSVAFAAEGAPAGAGTEADPILIASAADFAAVAADPAAYDGKYLALSGDLALSPDDFTPIGNEEAPFKGTFDGKGFQITGDKQNFLIDDYEMNGCGLFGYTENAEIRDFTCVNVSFSGGEMTGIVVGSATDTTVSGITVADEGCSVYTEVGTAGGVVGYLKNGTVADCVNKCEVEVDGGDNAGGIVGVAVDSQILRCKNRGNVTVSGVCCGGIVGSVVGTVSHCLNDGNVESTMRSPGSAGARAGGIAGFADGEISFCGNAGEVTSKKDCGGVIGKGSANVSDCYNAGALSGTAQEAIGNTTGTISSCVSAAEPMQDTGAYPKSWDFTKVWYKPCDCEGYPYPQLRDCHFHTIREENQPATCKDPGDIGYYCTNSGCGLEEHTEIQALGHIWNDGVITRNPTCSAKGEKKYTCTRPGCGETKLEDIDIDPNAHRDADNDNECDICHQKIKEEEQPAKRNFFQKIGDFFRRIFEWIKNLFKRK